MKFKPVSIRISIEPELLRQLDEAVGVIYGLIERAQELEAPTQEERELLFNFKREMECAASSIRRALILTTD